LCTHPTKIKDICEMGKRRLYEDNAYDEMRIVLKGLCFQGGYVEPMHTAIYYIVITEKVMVYVVAKPSIIVLTCVSYIVQYMCKCPLNFNGFIVLNTT
jgi:hypothetical protein